MPEHTTEYRRRMLVALAHPDDESFGMAGTLVRYSSQGVGITLICATNGDVGSADPAFMEGYETVADLRLDELRCAAQELGLAEVITLGYRDSGMPGTPDNDHPDSLHRADTDRVAGQITAVIRRVQPQVVVTFDPYGGYGHPDHVKMHEATTAAFHAAADPARYPEQAAVEGLQPWQPQKLYYMTFDRRMLRWFVALMALVGQDPEHMGRNRDINFREIARHVYPIHARITTRAYADRAERASLCHASQLGGLGRPSLVQRLRRVFTGLNVDTYMRAHPPVDGQRVRERDLFAGIVTD